jgi:uncharacterized protein YegP (UPF0339 family)
MVQICKTKKGNYLVVNVADNGEVLKSSEPLESKANCYKNIRAEMKSCYQELCDDYLLYLVVQDNTGKKPKVWHVGPKKKVLSSRKPQKAHVPK